MTRKRLLLATTIPLLLFFLVLSIFFVCNQSTASPIVQSKSETYLHFPSTLQGGAESKAYLISSQLSYGVYNESFSRVGATGDYSVNKGDPCVIINGTIRNDYDKDYYFAITANAYNIAGEKIGPILTANSPQPGFSVVHVNKGSVASFELQLKYDAKDVSNYDLLLALEPSEMPPP
jgi:hypothetical protein